VPLALTDIIILHIVLLLHTDAYFMLISACEYSIGPMYVLANEVKLK